MHHCLHQRATRLARHLSPSTRHHPFEPFHWRPCCPRCDARYWSAFGTPAPIKTLIVTKSMLTAKGCYPSRVSRGCSLHMNSLYARRWQICGGGSKLRSRFYNLPQSFDTSPRRLLSRERGIADPNIVKQKGAIVDGYFRFKNSVSSVPGRFVDGGPKWHCHASLKWYQLFKSKSTVFCGANLNALSIRRPHCSAEIAGGICGSFQRLRRFLGWYAVELQVSNMFASFAMQESLHVLWIGEI